MAVKVRFAPSPTGRLHVGNVRAALWNWLFARQNGGVFVLRIDDTDAERSTAAYEDGIKADLEWLGLVYNETFRQSERFSLYEAATEKLKTLGLLYPCYETSEELDRKRKLQRARGLPPIYDRAALALSAKQISDYEQEGRSPHWRFKLSHQPVVWNDLIRGETTVDTSSVSDPVLIREDGMYLYTLPSCVDDIETQITHVMRGEDHVTNTGVQIELIKALAGKPPDFAHHSLLVGADGQGLSKRLGGLSIESFRDAGLEAATITSLLARLGTSEPVIPQLSLEEMANSFSLDMVGRAPARFDPKDLELLNAKLLHETPYETVESRVKATGVTRELWQAVSGNISKIQDAVLWADIISGPIKPVIENKSLTDKAATLVPEEMNNESWSVLTKALQDQTGVKGKNLFMPLRLALTGQSRGPEMAALLPLIGAQKARARLKGDSA